MTWSDATFTAVPPASGSWHAAAAAGNAAVTQEAQKTLLAALNASAETPRPTHLLLKAAAGAGKSYALRRLIVAAAGAPGTRRIGVTAFTNNQVRPLATGLCSQVAANRVCLHLSRDAATSAPPGSLNGVLVSTTATAVPTSADVVIATASKLKAPGEANRLREHLGVTASGHLFDVLFVDEAWQLPHHLFDSLSGLAPLIVGVGDVGQLPPLEVGANPWRGDEGHNPYRAWPTAFTGKAGTWERELPTVWRPPGEALGLWRAFYPTWGELNSVAAPGDRRLVLGAEVPSAPLWRQVGSGTPTLVEVTGLPDSEAPDVDLPLTDQVEAWLDDLFTAGFAVETTCYADDGAPTAETDAQRPGTSDDGDPLVVVLATRNQAVDDATAMVERLRDKHRLRERDLVASTVDSWQGRTNAVTVAIHPLSGATALDEFNSAFGRLAVACTRATHGLLVLSRAGLDDLLAVAPVRPGTPFGEPGVRQLPRQTHQRILGAFSRAVVDVSSQPRRRTRPGSRLSDLIRQAKLLNGDLGDALESEVRHLQERRAFGLNFERHTPESVDLYGRPVRLGDKVRMLPPRGETLAPDKRLWVVTGGATVDGVRHADLQDPKTDDTATHPVDDLVVVAEHTDVIYPGLVSTGKVERGGDKPFHTVINGENLHALKALLYTHRGKVDAIYIDPPYNTGARDWKYNNDYVEADDLYRHSKWLAFMERRLVLAKQLLNPEDSVLIVTIDEKEYLRLGLLLEQTFPEAVIQMITTVINPKGTARTSHFSRTDEFIFFAFLGRATVPNITSGGEEVEVRWRYLRRTDVESRRGTSKGGPAQFYPIYVSAETGQIEEVGSPLPHGQDRETAPHRDGCIRVFPIREEDGMEMNWGLTVPSLKKALSAGYVRCSSTKSTLQPYVFQYLTAPNVARIETGDLVVQGLRPDGSKIVVLPEGKSSRPTTTWREACNDAGAYGTSLLRSFIPGRKFPFPKSLYAVENALRLAAASKPEATILDFFSGSGTTAQAVMRLNHLDGGRRQCISITNNEVGADEQGALRQAGVRPGDADWERWGICDYITKPRIKAAITGRTPDGEPVKGDYRFTDEFPMAEGFEENAEFFTLTYEAPLKVATHQDFERIAPLLWLRAGSRGRRIGSLASGWDVAEAYGVIERLEAMDDFLAALASQTQAKLAFIVTDDERRFQTACASLPDDVEPVRLYESYLRNFQIDAVRSSR